MCKTMKTKFLAGWIKGIICHSWSTATLLLKVIDKLLLEHVVFPHVLDLTVRSIWAFFLAG